MGYATALLQKIKDEITTDPTSRGYAGKTPLAQALLLGEPLAQTPQVYTEVTVNPDVIKMKLLEQNQWQRIASSTKNAAIRLVDICAIENVSIPSATMLDGILTELVFLGLLTATDKTVVLNLVKAEVLLSRADIIGCPGVREADVIEALALP